MTPTLRCLSRLLALVGLIGLHGCSQPSAPEPPRLRMQAVADPAEAEAYRKMLDAFQAAHPGVDIEFVPVGRHAEHVTRVVTAHAAGNAPDVFLINFRRWGQFLSHDLLQPVGPLLAELPSHQAEQFYAPALEAFTRGDELLCMPQNISSLVVYWNRAQFAAAGVAPPAANWTWTDFHDAAKALTRDLDGDGDIDVYGLDLDPSIVRLAPFIWQTKGRIVDNVDDPSRFMLAGRGGALGLMFLKRLKNEVGVMPSLRERRGEDPESRFLRGGAAMILQSRVFTPRLRAAPGLDWDVAPLPRYLDTASVLHSDAYCLSRQSQHQELARDLIAFATGEQGQTILARTGRIVPVRKSVAQGPAFLDPTQAPQSAQVFLDAIPTLRRTPNTPTWYEVETRINPLIEEWMFEPAGRIAGEANYGLVDGVRLAGMIQQTAQHLLKVSPP